jgi:hypothetical protein
MMTVIVFGVTSPIPAQAEASIEFTSVPAWGTYANLQGAISNAVPSEHGVAVYIYVEGWWTKPYFAAPVTTISADGTWTCDITTGGADQDATRIIAFLVPNGYSPPLMSGQSTLPQALYDTALDYAYAERSPHYRTLTFSGLTWTVKASILTPGSRAELLL